MPLDMPEILCAECAWCGKMEDAKQRCLSIMYRPKMDCIQAFFDYKCPKCFHLITILFETLTVPNKERKNYE